MREVSLVWDGHGDGMLIPLKNENLAHATSWATKTSRDAHWEWGDSWMVTGRETKWVSIAGQRPGSVAGGIVCSTNLPLLRRRGPLDVNDDVNSNSTRGSLGEQVTENLRLSVLVGAASAAEIDHKRKWEAWIDSTDHSGLYYLYKCDWFIYISIPLVEKSHATNYLYDYPLA